MSVFGNRKEAALYLRAKAIDWNLAADETVKIFECAELIEADEVRIRQLNDALSFAEKESKLSLLIEQAVTVLEQRVTAERLLRPADNRLPESVERVAGLLEGIRNSLEVVAEATRKE